jgi:hypothetical protein
MKLNGPQSESLSEALRDAFTPAGLNRMLSYKLSKQLSNYTSYGNGGDAQQVAFELLQAANADEWVDQLLLAAREAAPGNSKLFAVAQSFGAASTRASRQELERIVVESNTIVDVDFLRARIGALEPRVCRIEYTMNGKSRFGTGFLVAPDVVMTNHHVIRRLIGSNSAGAARFDYRHVYDGNGTLVRTNEGRKCAFATPWLIDSSPSTPDGQPTKPDELDYALVRLKDVAGNDTLDGGADPAAPVKRGFIGIPAGPHTYEKDSSLFIMQHPSAQPIKLALDTKSVIGLFDDGVRVRYTTNTEPGSSGSPCFNANWELTALHHSGDPDYDPAHKPTYNEGIPIHVICKLIEQRGFGAALGSGKD